MSFEEFIDAHMADIKYLRKRKILDKDEVNKLIVDGNAISGITVDDLEVTLVRRLLDNLWSVLTIHDATEHTIPLVPAQCVQGDEDLNIFLY
jgi:hypothetical protein